MNKLLILILSISLSVACSAGVVAKLPGGKEIKLYDNMYALVIGNSDYSGGWSKLPGAQQDAREVSARLQAMGFQVREAFNLSSAAMNKAISDFVYQQGREEDAALLLYYAGHGDTEQTADGEKLGYIIPVDTPLRHVDPQLFSERGISMTKIQEYSLKIQSRHVLMLFDSCFSGSIFALGRDPLPPAINEKVAAKVRQYITSGNENESVPDKSYFKTCFLQALDGDADLNRDGYVTGIELGNYLQDTVVNYTRSSQHPQYGKIRNPNLDKGDFVFALGQKASGSVASVRSSEYYSADSSTGSVVVKTSVAGSIYIDDKLISPISIGETKTIRNITTGLRVIELRSPQGNQNQRVNVFANDAVSVSFIVDLSHKGLIYVEGGSYAMGDASGAFHKDERPRHKVNISGFYIGKQEVTQQLFREVMGYNTSYFIDPRAPAEMVSWYEAIEFCNKLSLREGLQHVYTIDKSKKDPNNNQNDDDLKWLVSYDQTALGYRLPTEAEWEFAARGGLYGQGFEYAGSNDPLKYGWYSDERRDSYCETSQVGSFYPNELGIYDMSGNVYEWCWDWYGDYSAMDQNNPTGARGGEFRIVRGGCYLSEKTKTRVSQRGYEKPNRYYNVIGLRLVRSSGGF